MKRAIILVADSFGIGAADDAVKFGDQGSDTFGHIAQQCAAGHCDNEHRSGPLHLPNFERLGLGLAALGSTGQLPAGCSGKPELIGSYGYAAELSTGKDTPSGHWEIAGVPVLFDWGYFHEKENSFPVELLDKIVERANLPGYLANCHASGTHVLDDFGEEHMATGKPIFYTSADSVFQIACHEETFGLERLLELCLIVREELEPYNIGRVIARPFVGPAKGEFERTGNRRDYSLEPPAPTVLDKLVNEIQGDVISVGKIADIYAHCGITKKTKATGIGPLLDATLTELKTAPANSIVFTNLVDFDSAYGHRRDVTGYAQALEYLDQRLPEVIGAMLPDDILIITADHGCDPTWPGTDHTREHIPVLIYGKSLSPRDLGKSETFADIGQTLASYFGLSKMDYGVNLL
ncbi:phosphopentomutase [Motilimonas cestriensis]|uniref:Phosphopentomutase n=1 Tax=Motilimonas cestriensis TaxID=2742685 RepID=A0ABS8WFK3_9GAMM|nr:phosphopentomutase [Motilimonas cestriensis]MCE2596329.1 phosphopentomutase [Motilimonas cestriensis]